MPDEYKVGPERDKDGKPIFPEEDKDPKRLEEANKEFVKEETAHRNE